ncbi:hypothetical protein ACFWR6_06630 [Streptomyces griseus]|uniref:hypothetical protein n=1 Tax=Streptomyces griseus TaxID=1911 RepID=UPI00364D7C11
MSIVALVLKYGAPRYRPVVACVAVTAVFLVGMLMLCGVVAWVLPAGPADVVAGAIASFSATIALGVATLLIRRRRRR